LADFNELVKSQGTIFIKNKFPFDYILQLTHITRPLISRQSVNGTNGWFKYHFAFMGPTAGIVFKCELDLHAVATDKEGIRKYVLACREAGNVLMRIGYTKRQPFIFNIYYWLPKWLAPKVFKKLFTSRHAEVGIGLHARAIGSEFYEMVEEFAELKAKAGIETRNLDEMLAYIPHE